MGTSVAVIGTGYVGLVTALSLAHHGRHVMCVDVDREKVEGLNRGTPAFYEPGVAEALRKAVKVGQIEATLDGVAAVRASSFAFLCVGTPPRKDGTMDVGQVLSAAAMVGQGLKGHPDRSLVIVKSTVLPGTTESTVLPALRKAAGPKAEFGLCVNPEFLREGSALEDALSPDRIVIGERDKESGDALEALYAPFPGARFRTDLRTAEMVKYATNAFLATKISFANELANLCGRLGVDWDRVVEGMGLDPRINPRFFVPGVGFGGSCFPKDVAALVAAGKSKKRPMRLLSAVLAVNEKQPDRAIELLEEEIGALAGRKVAVLGLAFKAGTDDVRESRAVPLVNGLLGRKAKVVAYDPVAGPNFLKVVPQVKLATSVREALEGAMGCVIQADWPQFRTLTARDFAVMKKPVVVDGRRTLQRKSLGDRVVYRRIG